MNQVNLSAELLKSASTIVILTGAGMSTESGMKDFRSKNGLGSVISHGYSPEEILSRSFFYKHPDLFYNYVKEHLNTSGISPNKGHFILAEWETRKTIHIITQNIDLLHQQAGSSKVLPLHGTLDITTCTHCASKKSLKKVFYEGYHCECGGIFKPDIVLYDEEVSNMHSALSLLKEADLLLVLGTSLRVYPAARIPEVYQTSRKPMIIVNKDETPYAHDYHVIEIHESIGSTLAKINKLLKF